MFLKLNAADLLADRNQEMPHGCPNWSFNLTGDEEGILFQLVIRPLKQRVLVHEIGKIDTMKSYVYRSKKSSSLPTILKL